MSEPRIPPRTTSEARLPGEILRYGTRVSLGVAAPETLRSAPPRRPGVADEPAESSLWFDGASYRLRWEAGPEVRIDPAGRSIQLVHRGGCTDWELSRYVEGPALGLAVRLQGRLALHASALVRDGIALALLGSSGIGKSTLAAALARGGAAVLSDDVVVVEHHPPDCYLAHPGTGHLLLWDDSIGGLGIGSPAIEVRAWWDKRQIDAERAGWTVAREPTAIGGLFVLEPTGPEQPFSLHRLTGGRAALAAVGHGYASHWLDGERRARELDAAARLAELVPIWTLRVPRSLERVCELTWEELRRCATAS